MGLYFEDFHADDLLKTLGRTLTEADVVNFAGFSGDFHPLHTDAEYARQTAFGERVGHGLIGLAFVSGLLGRLSLFEGTGLAFLELKWKFLGPLRLGDTLHVRQLVLNKRETSSPDRGVVTFQIELVNQNGQVVQQGERVLLIARRREKVGGVTAP